jgi:hypothetical protein
MWGTLQSGPPARPVEASEPWPTALAGLKSGFRRDEILVHKNRANKCFRIIALRTGDEILNFRRLPIPVLFPQAISLCGLGLQ